MIENRDTSKQALSEGLLYLIRQNSGSTFWLCSHLHVLAIGTAILNDYKCFRLGYQNILPKTKVFSEKKVNTRFAASTCVDRGTIHRRTRVNIDNFTAVKNRNILLTGQDTGIHA